MAEYKKFPRSNDRPQRPFAKKPFGNKGGGFGGGFAQKELFDAQCNSCKERCQVPFKPNGMKPVYCSKCFTKDESPSRDYGSRDGSGSSTYGNRSDFKPRHDRPSFTPEAPNRQIEQLSKQIEMMNSTLQNLVATLTTSNRATALTEEVRKLAPSESFSDEAPAKKSKAAPSKKVAKAKKVVKKTAKK